MIARNRKPHIRRTNINYREAPNGPAAVVGELWECALFVPECMCRAWGGSPAEAYEAWRKAKEDSEQQWRMTLRMWRNMKADRRWVVTHFAVALRVDKIHPIDDTFHITLLTGEHRTVIEP